MNRRLVVDDGRTARELLLVGTMVVGRDPECEISHRDPRLSRRHAEFSIGEHGVLVRDLESRNGIRVNGRVVKEALLQPGDLVQIAQLSVRFVEDDAETPPVRRSGATALPSSLAVAASTEDDRTRIAASGAFSAALAHVAVAAAVPPRAARQVDDDRTRVAAPGAGSAETDPAYLAGAAARTPAYETGAAARTPAYGTGAAARTPAYGTGAAARAPAYGSGAASPDPAYGSGAASRTPAHGTGAAGRTPAHMGARGTVPDLAEVVIRDPLPTEWPSGRDADNVGTLARVPWGRRVLLQGLMLALVVFLMATVPLLIWQRQTFGVDAARSLAVLVPPLLASGAAGILVAALIARTAARAVQSARNPRR